MQTVSSRFRRCLHGDDLLDGRLRGSYGGARLGEHQHRDDYERQTQADDEQQPSPGVRGLYDEVLIVVADATGTLLHRTTSREDGRYCSRDAVCVNSFVGTGLVTSRSMLIMRAPAFPFAILFEGLESARDLG